MQRPTRVLIITPWVPYPVSGACQQDRFWGMKELQAAGYDIHVVSKIHSFQDREEVERVFARENIPLTLSNHSNSARSLFGRNAGKVFMNPLLIDGAALEYADTAFQQLVAETIQDFQPDVGWLEFTVLWPLLPLFKKQNIPTIIKSTLNEGKSCIAEHGDSILSRIKALPKYAGERIAAQHADMLLAITPEEEKWYRSLGAVRTGTLPLRGLCQCFFEKTHVHKDILDVVFLSSNYNMGHNRDALEFLLTKIIPEVRRQTPGKFRFHLTGRKFPEHLKSLLADDVRQTGFVEDLGAFLATMDIALCPWITGHGMQQKVFEPLCRCLPLLTTKTDGYPFENGKELLLCQTPNDYVNGLRLYMDADVRNAFAQAAYAKCQQLFSEQAVTSIMVQAIDLVTRQSLATV